MWITPRPLANFQDQYDVIQENQFMQMYGKKSSLFGSLFARSEEFLIGIKNEPKSIISICGTKQVAEEHWKWIDFELLSTLSKDPADQNEMISFLQTKFNDLPSSSTRGKLVEEALTEQSQFRTRFNLPNENLIATFLSSYWKVIYCAGTMYLGHTSLCFTSPLLTDDVMLPFLQIKSIERDSSFGVNIKTEKNEHWFTFLDREAALETIKQQWELAMDKHLHRAEFVLKSTDNAKSNTTPLRLSKKISQGTLATNIQKRGSQPSDGMGNTNISRNNPKKKQEKRKKRARKKKKEFLSK